MDLIDYIYDECHRQHVTNYGDFAKAWADVVKPRDINDADDFGLFVQVIARNVEPEVNIHRWVGGSSFDNLRISHVGFMNGGSAAPVNEVRPRFDRWCENAFYLVKHPSSIPHEQNRYIEGVIRGLLQIHPWVDGNGRTASILRNWMLNRLDDPEPLPYYDF